MDEVKSVEPTTEEKPGIPAIDPLSAMGLRTPEEEAEKREASPSPDQTKKAEMAQEKPIESPPVEPPKSEAKEPTPETETDTSAILKQVIGEYMKHYPPDQIITITDNEGNIVGAIPRDGVIALKVEGQEVKKPFSEVIKDAQKLAYSDKVLQEAVEKRKAAEQELASLKEAMALVATMPTWDDKELLQHFKPVLKFLEDEPDDQIKQMVDLEALKSFLTKRDAVLYGIIQNTQKQFQDKIASLSQRYTQKAVEIAKAKSPTLFTLLGEDEAPALLLNVAFREMEAKKLLTTEDGKLVEVADEVLTQYLDGAADQLEKKLNDMVKASYVEDLKHEIELLRADPVFRKEVAEEYLKEQGKLDSVKVGEGSASGGPEPEEKGKIDDMMARLGIA